MANDAHRTHALYIIDVSKTLKIQNKTLNSQKKKGTHPRKVSN